MAYIQNNYPYVLWFLLHPNSPCMRLVLLYVTQPNKARQAILEQLFPGSSTFIYLPDLFYIDVSVQIYLYSIPYTVDIYYSSIKLFIYEEQSSVNIHFNNPLLTATHAATILLGLLQYICSNCLSSWVLGLYWYYI